MPTPATEKPGQKAGSSTRPLKNGQTTPPVDASETEHKAAGKPDQAAYNLEQENLKKEIDEVHKKLTVIKDKISPAAKGGPQAERRTVLRAEMDSIKGEQSDSKQSREKIIDQLKAINEGVQKKTQELQASKSKVPHKTVAGADDQIKKLEKQVESGNLKLVDEKRALQEIGQIKRSRRLIEGFEASQHAIDAERAKADELRKQLDDPTSKAASERFDTIKNELDEIKKEGDEVYANRSKLLDERTKLQAELDSLYDRKRKSAQDYREGTDRYYQKARDDRNRRQEKYRTQRAEEEAEKKKEVADQLLEEARAPAFQANIEDCQTLIDFFAGKIGSATPTPITPVSAVAPDVAGVAKLDLRQVDQDLGKGMVPLKKKVKDEEENYFVSSKSKKKGGSKTPVNGADSLAPPTLSVNTNIHIPLAKLSALMSLSIPPPTSTADVPRIVEDLKKKKAWYEANQSRQTKENVAKAEAAVAKLDHTPDQLTPPNGDGEDPAEPVPTPPSKDGPLADPVVGVAVDKQLVEELKT